jgi:hypothetical protein
MVTTFSISVLVGIGRCLGRSRKVELVEVLSAQCHDESVVVLGQTFDDLLLIIHRLAVALEALLQHLELLSRFRLHFRQRLHTLQTTLKPAQSLATDLLLVFYFGDLLVLLRQLRHEPVAFVLAALELAFQVVELIRLLRDECRARGVDVDKPAVGLKLARPLELLSEIPDLGVAIRKMTF